MKSKEINTQPQIKEILNLPERMVFLNPTWQDLFFAAEHSETSLLDGINQDGRVLEQAQQRRELFNTMQSVFSGVPDTNMDLSGAFRKQLIPPDQLTNFYVQLSAFIQSDNQNDRLVIQLPFQVLPDKSDGSTVLPEKLEHAQNVFTQVYMKSWRRLLNTSESRDNYVDGDFFDFEQGKDLVEVVKVAHFIPELVRRNLLDVREVFDLLETTENEELKLSIIDTLPLLEKLGYITKDDWQKYPVPQPKYSFMQFVEFSVYVKDNNEDLPINEYLNSEYVKSVKALKASADVAHNSDIDKLAIRVEWEEKEIDKGVKKRLSDIVASNYIGGTVTQFDLARLATGENQLFQEIVSGSLPTIIQKLGCVDIDKAREFAAKNLDVFLTLMKKKDSRVVDQITTGLSYCYKEGIIDSDYLKVVNVQIPKMTTPELQDVQVLTKDFIEPSLELVKDLQENPEFNKIFYPIILLYGSRLKNYHTSSSDMDSVLFSRPAKSKEERRRIKDLAKKLVSQVEGLSNNVLYLDEDESSFGLVDYEDGHPLVSRLNWVHITHNALWLGEEDTVSSVKSDLERAVFDLSQFGRYKDEARRVAMFSLETDALRSGLMFKGYERYNQTQRPYDLESGSTIDADSTFWDPGYRQVASQLFVSRVFLPDLCADS